jgi:hypothetical protein
MNWKGSERQLTWPLWRGTRQRSWLRHYATNRKLAGSSPDEVDIFNLPNPSSRFMALGSTQPLTEKSTRSLLGGKGRPARRADNLTAICDPIVWSKFESLDVSQPYGPSRHVAGLPVSLSCGLFGMMFLCLPRSTEGSQQNLVRISRTRAEVRGSEIPNTKEECATEMFNVL